MRALKAIAKNYKTSTSGNMAVIGAVGIPLLLGAVAVGLTTTQTFKVRQDLQRATDVAALGATTVIEQNRGQTKKAREEIAEALFEENFLYPNAPMPTPDINVVENNGVIDSTVSASVEVENILSGFLPSLKTRVSVESFATSSRTAIHTEIHFIVDNSMSMGIGQTMADRTDMLNNASIRSVGPEPCAVACHIPARSTHDSYDYYKNAGVRMRIDAVRDALAAFLDDLNDLGDRSSATRVGIMVSGDRVAADLDADELSTIEGSIDRAIVKANAIELEARPWRGDTVLSTNLALTANRIKSGGTGASIDSPLSYVVLMTDGIENTEISEPNYFQSDFSVPDAEDVDSLIAGGMSSMDAEDTARRIQVMDPSRCDSVKATGATLIVMNIEYGMPERFARGSGAIQHYTDPAIASWGNVRRVMAIADMRPEIEDELRECASHPSLLFSVESETEMDRAFDQILETLQDVKHVRLAR